LNAIGPAVPEAARLWRAVFHFGGAGGVHAATGPGCRLFRLLIGAGGLFK